MFCKKRVLKNFTRKLLFRRLFLIKLHAEELRLYCKKRRQHWCFSINLVKFEHLFYRTPPVAVSVISGKKNIFNPVSGKFLITIYMKQNRNETHSSCHFLAVILAEITFHFGWYVLCTHYPEMKHLRKLLPHQNKDSRSKDQNKNEFHLISPARKAIANRIFLTEKQTFISGLL